MLKGEPKEKLPEGWRSSGPLAQGLSVFLVTARVVINLGPRIWTELVLLVSSEDAMDTNLDRISGAFQTPQQ